MDFLEFRCITGSF